jgi:preprotein translocase subunit SecG
MQTLFIVLIIIASVLLSFFVLIQNPKGGGLVSGFAGSTNLMGVKRTGDFLEKSTWVLIITIIVLSLIVNVMPSSNTGTSGRAGDIQTTSPAIMPELDQQGTQPLSTPTPGDTILP